MSDLVKRLWDWAECVPNDLFEGVSADLFAAADEIERLRAALWEAVEWDGHDAEGVEAVWLEQARIALAGEKTNDSTRKA